MKAVIERKKDKTTITIDDIKIDLKSTDFWNINQTTIGTCLSLNLQVEEIQVIDNNE